MSLWETVTWDVARAGGFTAFGLLTLSIAIGLALTLHWQSLRWPRLINSELHNFLTLLALIFTGIHVLAVWVDPFTSFNWNEVFIPFVSHYRPLWMALGIVAFYIGLAIGLSTWLRPYIGYRWWRRLHVLTLLLYGLVVVHGIGTGSDTRTWWGAAIYACSVLLVGTVLWQRLKKPANTQSSAHPVLAVASVATIGIVAFWTMLGPLQPGWNNLANNGNGSGATSKAVAAQAQQPSTTQRPSTVQQPSTSSLQSFSGDLQGQYTRNSSNGNVTMQFDLNILNGASGKVRVILQGQSGGDDGGIAITSSKITLSSSTGLQLYNGSLNNISGGRRIYMAGVLIGTGANSGSQIQVQMEVRVDQSGQVTGSIATASTNPAGNSNESNV